MKKYKRNLLILILSVCIYFVLTYLYNSLFTKDNMQEICILKKDYTRGSKIDKSDIITAKLKQLEIDSLVKYISASDLDNFVISKDMEKGDILTNNSVIKNDEYIKSSDEKEIVSIKVVNSQDVASYQIGKNSVINIYYTGKTSQASTILNTMNIPSISSDNISDGYTTVKILENIKILNIFDKYGNKMNIKNEKKNETSIIDTIMIEVSKKDVASINNLSKYGTFSISIIK